MSYWEIMEEQDDYGRGGFGMRDDEVERAYREGCKKGYEKARQEGHGRTQAQTRKRAMVLT